MLHEYVKKALAIQESTGFSIKQNHECICKGLLVLCLFVCFSCLSYVSDTFKFLIT